METAKSYKLKERCRLCNAPIFMQSPVFSLPSTPLANSFTKTREAALALPAFPLDVFACGACGHHQLGIVVNAEEMFSNYAYASGTSKSFVQHFTDYAREIVRRYYPMNGSGLEPERASFRVLEVGSNDGTMLHALKNAGVSHATGIEPATNLVMKCLGDGLNVVRGYANESTITHHNIQADFWVANNVLAHVDDFVGTLKALALTGAKAGVFEVQYLGALLDGGMFDMVYHEHLDYWRATELVEHLHEHTPWVVVDIEQVPTHGGSLRVWVERTVAAGGTVDNVLSTRAAGLAEQEDDRDWPVNWLALQQSMELERKRLWALLGDDKSVAVYGCPAKLTTLLYGLKLTNLNFTYAVDDSPLKQGLHTPGMGLEVRNPLSLSLDPPDAILVGAWNFAKHIVPNIKRLEVPIVTPFEK